CWVAGPTPGAEGGTNPSIDDLLTKTDSKYKLVLYSAKRARQINAYYSQLGEGLLEYVGPLVETHVQEKPLSIALREINDDLLTCEDVDPAELAAEEEARKAAALETGFSGECTDPHDHERDGRFRSPVRGTGAAIRPSRRLVPRFLRNRRGRGRRGHRGVQGRRAGAPLHRVRPRRDRGADTLGPALRRRGHLG